MGGWQGKGGKASTKDHWGGGGRDAEPINAKTALGNFLFRVPFEDVMREESEDK